MGGSASMASTFTFAVSIATVHVTYVSDWSASAKMKSHKMVTWLYTQQYDTTKTHTTM
jgi:hypothetical protein